MSDVATLSKQIEDLRACNRNQMLTIQEYRRKVAELETAARALFRKLDLIHNSPAEQVFWRHVMSHGITVPCIDCIEELAVLRDALDSGAPVASIAGLSLGSTKLDQPVSKIEAIKNAVRDYHYALDTRQDGNFAGYRLTAAVQDALGMNWVRGAEKQRREALKPQEGGK